MVENRPLDVNIATADLKTLSSEQRLLRKQWEDAVASGSTKAHPYAINRDTEAYPAGVALDVDPYEGYVPPTPGGSDPTEAIATAIAPLDTRLEVVEETLPEKVTGTQVDQKIAAKSSKFRGDWSPGELVWSEDFSGGLPSGAPWTFGWAGGPGGTPAFQVVAMSAAQGSSKPAYANCLRIPSNGSRDNDTSRAILDLNAIPALQGKVLTTISYWSTENRVLTGGSPTAQFRDGATAKYSRTLGDNAGYPWTKQTYTLAGLDNDLTWETIVNGQANPNNTYWVAGIEIYASSAPYMLGEFVLYKGKMWKSTTNNNSTTPGSSATWTETPVNFNQVYATASRPSAASAGEGAQIYDGDLDLALWSNGTVWRDAAGTAR